MAGLTKKKVTVRSKSGKVYQRSMLVRAGQAVKRTANRAVNFVGRNKGKIALATGTALAVGSALALNRHKLMGAGRGVGLALNAWRHGKANGDDMSVGQRLKSIAKGAHAGFVSNRGMDKALHEHVSDARGRAGGAINSAITRVQGAMNRRADAAKRAVAAASPPPPPAANRAKPKRKRK